MADLLYYLVEKMAGIHDVLMTLNDSYETMLSDKELHFIVIGVQGITNTGNMEMEDIVSGLAGFMFLFIIFAVLRAIVLGIVHLVRGIMGWDDDDDDDDDE